MLTTLCWKNNENNAVAIGYENLWQPYLFEAGGLNEKEKKAIYCKNSRKNMQ